MKLHRKLLIVVLLVAALITVNQPVVAAHQSASKITLWHYWGGARVPLMEQQIAAFQKANAAITVDAQLQPADKRLETLLAAIAADNPPDVVMFKREEIASFVLQDALTPLDDFMKADKIAAEVFYPAEIDAARYKGQIWGLPQPTGGAQNMLWYNKESFRKAGLDPAKPPQTWAEFKDVATKLTTLDNGALKIMGVDALNSGGETPPFIVWLQANGGKWISDDLKKAEFNSPQGLEALQFLIDMTELNGGYEERNAFIKDISGQNSPFYKGDTAIEVEGSWQYALTVAANPKLEFGVAPLPYGPSGSAKARGSAYGGWSYVIPKKAKNPQAGWELVKWLTTDTKDKGACWFLQQQKRPSPLIACNEDPVSGEGNPVWKDIIAAQSLDIPTLTVPIQPQVNKILNSMLEQVMFKKLTPEEGLKTAAAQVQAELDKFWATAK